MPSNGHTRSAPDSPLCQNPPGGDTSYNKNLLISTIRRPPLSPVEDTPDDASDSVRADENAPELKIEGMLTPNCHHYRTYRPETPSVATKLETRAQMMPTYETTTGRHNLLRRQVGKPLPKRPGVQNQCSAPATSSTQHDLWERPDVGYIWMVAGTWTLEPSAARALHRKN